MAGWLTFPLNLDQGAVLLQSWTGAAWQMLPAPHAPNVDVERFAITTQAGGTVYAAVVERDATGNHTLYVRRR